MSDNELDNLFKEAADGFKAPGDPSAWQDMARRLDQTAPVTTASFWNWKTISTTAIIGLTIVAFIFYVSIPDSNPAAELNPEVVTSVDPASTSATEKETFDSKSPEITSESSVATPNIKKENSLGVEENNQQKTDPSIAVLKSGKETADSKSPEITSKSGAGTPNSKKENNLAGEKNNQQKTDPSIAVLKSGKETNVETVSASHNTTQKDASQLNTQSEQTKGNVSSSVPANSEFSKNETRNLSTEAAAATLTGVAGTGTVLAPAASGSVSSREGKVSQVFLEAKDSQAQVVKEVEGNTEAVKVEGNTEGVAKQAVAEKTMEQTGSGKAKSEGSSTQPASLAADSKSQPVGGEVDSQKKSEGENEAALAKATAAGKILEPSGSDSNVVTGETNNSNQAALSGKGSKTQSIIAGDTLKKAAEVKQQEALNEKASDKSEKEVKEENLLLNRFAIKLAVAPDYTTVKSATPNSLGINYGVLLEYRLSKHWSVATGGIWSKKIYSAYDVEYSGYHADWVDGDCRMWDIPINVYYNFSSNKPFSFYASLGLSSYLMNEENYVYYVETSYGTYDYPKQVKGENNEWFKTLNVSVGMQYRISQQFSLQFEPTLKAPLAGVGEGEVSLVSLGAFFNLRYEIPINKLRRNED